MLCYPHVLCGKVRQVTDTLSVVAISLATSTAYENWTPSTRPETTTDAKTCGARFLELAAGLVFGGLVLMGCDSIVVTLRKAPELAEASALSLSARAWRKLGLSNRDESLPGGCQVRARDIRALESGSPTLERDSWTAERRKEEGGFRGQEMEYLIYDRPSRVPLPPNFPSEAPSGAPCDMYPPRRPEKGGRHDSQ